MKVWISPFCYLVLPSTVKNIKHVLHPVAPAQCSKSSYIDHSENDKNLHDDTKGEASKIYMKDSQNNQTCTCRPHN